LTGNDVEEVLERLWLREGIFRAPLRDLRGVRTLPKLLARIVEQIAAGVREWSGKVLP